MRKYTDIYKGEEPPKRKDVLWVHHSVKDDLTSPVVVQIFSKGKWVDAYEGGGGSGSDTNAVKYTEQSLTNAQKTQARTNIGAGTYNKPQNGIPSTDLASEVQASLGKADSALQSQEQSDWNESDDTKASYIKNKPVIPSLGSVPKRIQVQDITAIPDVTIFKIGDIAEYDDHDYFLAYFLEGYEYIFISFEGNGAVIFERYEYGGNGYSHDSSYVYSLSEFASKNDTPQIYIESDITDIQHPEVLKPGDIIVDGADSAYFVLSVDEGAEIDILSVTNAIGIYVYLYTQGAYEYYEAGSTSYTLLRDSTPTNNSPRLVTSGGVYSALSDKENSANKVTSLSAQLTNTQYPSAKCVYDAINPPIVTIQPVGGFEPGKKYRLGTLTGNVTFALSNPTDSNISNVYWWTFETGSTTPTVTWPSGVVWPDGVTPSIDSGKHYEVRVEDGYISYQVFTVPNA